MFFFERGHPFTEKAFFETWKETQSIIWFPRICLCPHEALLVQVYKSRFHISQHMKRNLYKYDAVDLCFAQTDKQDVV